MKRFEVVYLEQGQRKTIQTTANSREELQKQFLANGHLVMRIKNRAVFREKRFPLHLFIQELIALLEAGLVVTEAIEALQASCQDPQIRYVYDQLLEKLYQGCQLSQAMATLPAIFPDLLLNTVASSEHTGHLPCSLQRFQHYEKRMETLRKRIKSTLMYPTIVMSVGGLILVFLLGFIIPRFALVFEGMKNLNSSARFILWWGNLVETQGGYLLLVLISSIAGLVFIAKNTHLRRVALSLLLKLPRLRQQHQLTLLVRFYRTLGLLLEGGLPVIQALSLTRSVLPVSHHAQVEHVLKEVNSGLPLSTTLESGNLTTPIAGRLLHVGERSGELPEMCERIAAFYDEELERAIEVFSKVFEPILMMVVGGIVGLVVFLLYMPIFELAGGIS